MNFELFFAEMEEKKVELETLNAVEGKHVKLSNEALFQMPLISLSVLIFACENRKPTTSELGQLVGECYERTFQGFKGSSQTLGWSANLRVRTVKALTFLEVSKLVIVKPEHKRIAGTDIGKKLRNLALSKNDHLSLALHHIQRNYTDIKTEKQLALEI